MSFQAMQAAQEDPRPPTSNARHVLITLADYADKQLGSIRPSLATIAKRTMMSQRAVRIAMRQLELCGSIQKLEAIDGKPIEYRMTPAPDSSPPRHHVPTPPEPHAAPPRQNLHLTPAPRSANPIPESSHNNLRSARASSPDGLALARQGAPERPSRASEPAPEFIVTREGKDAFKAQLAADIARLTGKPAQRSHTPDRDPTTLAASNPADIERRRREAAAIVEREMAKRTGL